MTILNTDLGATRESARRLRVEPTGGISATNTQKALEGLDSIKVPATRLINTTAPLAGGGDLSADRTHSITGAAGQVLAGAAPAFTATPILGASGIFGSLAFGNATSGLLTLQAVTGALGAVTVSLPAATDTLVGKATTDALTNKTYDTAGTGNVFNVNGAKLVSLGATLTISATVLQTAAHTGDVTTPANSFVTTCLKTNGVAFGPFATVATGTSGGVPFWSSASTIGSSALLAANGIMVGGGSGTAPNTGTNFSFSAANVLVAGVNASITGAIDFTNGGVGGASARVQNASATVAYNFNLPGTAGSSGQPLLSGGGGGAAQTYGTLGQGAGGTGQTTLAAYLATFPKPTTQVFTSGSGTYTTPANVTWIEVMLQGAGSGGQGSGAGAGNSLAGGNTTFSTLTANGGAASVNAGTPGGTGSGGDINIVGGTGGPAVGTATATGGNGGASAFGGNGWGAAPGAGAGLPGATNTGAGGGGGGSNGSANAGGGGGAGAHVVKIIASPGATLSFAVGVGATGGTAGTSGAAGGNGGSGLIRVVEHYN